MADLVGHNLGSYRIVARLGHGGMGEVYSAIHTLLNRPAAIKVLHADQALDPTFQARFLREARAAAALSHPNIVEVFDFGEQDAHSYLVMELVPDGSLRSLLRQRAKGDGWSLGLGVDLVRQAAEGLAYAHAHGMIHRDIKPDNLLLQKLEPTERASGAEQYLLKISDFGLARLIEDTSELTATGVVMGTPAYMSPEQCQGADVDGRSDLYSLGVVLYEVATGSQPFRVKTLSEAVFKHISAPPIPPRDVRPDLPIALEDVILRCLAKRPADRFATGTELADALEEALTETASTTIVTGQGLEQSTAPSPGSGGATPSTSVAPSAPTMASEPSLAAHEPVAQSAEAAMAAVSVAATIASDDAAETVAMAADGADVDDNAAADGATQLAADGAMANATANATVNATAPAAPTPTPLPVRVRPTGRPTRPANGAQKKQSSGSQISQVSQIKPPRQPGQMTPASGSARARAQVKPPNEPQVKPPSAPQVKPPNAPQVKPPSAPQVSQSNRLSQTPKAPPVAPPVTPRQPSPPTSRPSPQVVRPPTPPVSRPPAPPVNRPPTPQVVRPPVATVSRPPVATVSRPPVATVSRPPAPPAGREGAGLGRLPSWAPPWVRPWMFGLGGVGVVALIVIVLVVNALGGHHSPALAVSRTPSPTIHGTATSVPVTPSPTPVEKVIFQDSLATNDHGWSLSSHSYYANGGYEVQGAWISYAPTNGLGNGTISLRMRQLGGPSDQFYGILLRGVNDNLYYFFGVSASQQWTFSLVTNGNGKALVAPTTNSHIVAGLGGANTLTVQAQGSHFVFLINDVVVGQANDATISSGSIGLINTVGNLNVVYNNLVISVPA